MPTETIMSHKISKSCYLNFETCPKWLWLSKNKPELGEISLEDNKQVKDGKEVDAVAKQYFEGTVDVTSFDENGDLNIPEMIAKTNFHILSLTPVIAQASFSVENMFCSIDLLKLEGNQYDIYEVKACTESKKEHYLDAAYQKYVLTKKGFDIREVNLLLLNKTYKRKGELDLNELFYKERVDNTEEFIAAYLTIKEHLEMVEQVLDSKDEPIVPFRGDCKACPFSKYCLKDIPRPGVIDINNLRGRFDYLNQGIVTYSDVLMSPIKLNERQLIQIKAYQENKERIVNKRAVKDFLKNITYPAYHLDFETIQLPIPPSDDSWAYEQIPTQYSLHIEYADGHLEHKEFLGHSIDPRREIAEALCKDIPADKCVLAYNKTFECSRLRELASLYPDLEDHLKASANNIVDLIVPFKAGTYYDSKMVGSNSIKAVLPALYPDDPELDYHALPVVHNGGEAMDIYPTMLKAEPKEQERIRDGLLKYCCLDTLAMVKVLRKLVEDSK